MGSIMGFRYYPYEIWELTSHLPGGVTLERYRDNLELICCFVLMKMWEQVPAGNTICQIYPPSQPANNNLIHPDILYLSLRPRGCHPVDDPSAKPISVRNEFDNYGQGGMAIAFIGTLAGLFKPGCFVFDHDRQVRMSQVFVPGLNPDVTHPIFVI